MYFWRDSLLPGMTLVFLHGMPEPSTHTVFPSCVPYLFLLKCLHKNCVQTPDSARPPGYTALSHSNLQYQPVSMYIHREWPDVLQRACCLQGLSHQVSQAAAVQ